MSDMAKEEGGRGGAARGPRYATYLAAYAALVSLTGITVATASMGVGRAAIAIVLGIAGTKSLIVLLYFMHLRWEKRVLVKALIPIVVAALAVFIGLTYTDILYR